MSYQTYTTEAIVCGSRDRGSSDRVYWLFTRDAGMVIARAKSVREARSKLRYGLQDFSMSQVSLIRGKQEWRVTGTEPQHNLFFASTDRAGRGAVLRTVRLVRRLLPGEDPHPALFDAVKDALHFLAAAEDDADAELIATVRILNHLGYVAPSAAVRTIVDAPTLKEARMGITEAVRREVSRVVDAALVASQL